MRNFKITNNNKLQKRPGTRNIANLLFDYALEVAEEPTVLLTETIESTAEFQVYPLVQITDDGLPSISGTPATVTYGNAEGHEGEYYRDDNGVIYMLGGCVYDSGIIGGVQQYRWNKWTCVVSSVPQYSYNTYTVDSGYLPAEPERLQLGAIWRAPLQMSAARREPSAPQILDGLYDGRDSLSR